MIDRYRHLRSSKAACELIISFALLVGTRLCVIKGIAKDSWQFYFCSGGWWSRTLLPHWSALATNWTGVGITVINYNRSPSVLHLHYIYAFSRCFYPKRLTLHSSYSFTFYQLLLSLGIEPMILALLAPCSTIWATGKLKCYLSKWRTAFRFFHNW